jgi:prophage tail gpP-like protein
MKGSLILGRGGNVLSANYNANYTERFSKITVSDSASTKYFVKVESEGGSKALSESPQATSYTIESKLLTNRHRPLTVLGNGVSSRSEENTVETEAKWRMAMSRASVGTSSVKVQGWLSQEDDLWRVGKLVYCKMPDLNMPKGEMLIKNLTFNLGDDGSYTTLELIHKDAFDDTDFNVEEKTKTQKEFRVGIEQEG